MLPLKLNVILRNEANLVLVDILRPLRLVDVARLLVEHDLILLHLRQLRRRARVPNRVRILLHATHSLLALNIVHDSLSNHVLRLLSAQVVYQTVAVMLTLKRILLNLNLNM